jgi:hypothetical protein
MKGQFFFIPGFIISILTFPGVILHEFAHKKFCDFFKVNVHEVCYFRFGNPAGYVAHEKTTNFKQTFMINVSPFLVNTIFALVVFWFARNIINPDYLHLILLWIGFSFGMNSFPSSEDAKILWRESKEYFKAGNLLATIGLPISILIRIANILRMIWFDLFYALALYLLINGISVLQFLTKFSNP